jgi:hypothetical protein
MTKDEAHRIAYRVRAACRMICTEADRTNILKKLDEIATELENVEDIVHNSGCFALMSTTCECSCGADPYYR